METTLTVMERQQQFDFQKNGIEVMNFETLQRTYKENDIYNNPVQGIYHYQVIRRMMDICEKYNLDYEVEEIFAAQNRNKTQPGVSILPQVEQTHGEKAVEAHILRRIFATIRIKDWETDELTTTLVIAYHQDGIQAAIGPCVLICHNQCILSPERSVCNYGKKKVSTEEVLKLAMSKGQITAWELYNIATEIYKPGKTDFPALIPQNGAMAELLLSRLPEELEVQDAVQVN